jgi:hypothetical protein
LENLQGFPPELNLEPADVLDLHDAMCSALEAATKGSGEETSTWSKQVGTDSAATNACLFETVSGSYWEQQEASWSAGTLALALLLTEVSSCVSGLFAGRNEPEAARAWHLLWRSQQQPVHHQRSCSRL